MNRIIAFIDGFNLYHAIAKSPQKSRGQKDLRMYKWLDLNKLIHCYVTSNNQVKSIYYFTAYANWIPPRAAKHKIYVRALESKNIQPVFGIFKVKDNW